jgi:hypothetical protein
LLIDVSQSPPGNTGPKVGARAWTGNYYGCIVDAGVDVINLPPQDAVGSMASMLRHGLCISIKHMYACYISTCVSFIQAAIAPPAEAGWVHWLGFIDPLPLLLDWQQQQQSVGCCAQQQGYCTGLLQYAVSCCN